jgi:cell fate regulator YaaT (PSP1 superfamily)
MPQTVEVRFKGTRRDFFLWSHDDAPLRLKEGVIVEVDRGRDFGRVSAIGEAALKKCGDGCNGCATDNAPNASLRTVIRRASQQDVKTANELRRIEEDIRRKVIERVRSHSLEMKVSDAEWQWDRRKLSIFFTAEHRVDFRALVRDLAAQFRTRIDLRQIGVRDEAARLTGIGRCGREYCCSTWLPELAPVSLSLAKDQHLALNPSQISGGCGRLLCCLKYEHDFYVTSRKRFPKEGKELSTERGKEKVVAVDIFRERVFLRSSGHGTRIVPLVALREEIDRARETPGVDAPATKEPAPAPIPAPAAEAPASPPSPIEPATTAPSADAEQPTAHPPEQRARRRRRRGRGRGRGRRRGRGGSEGKGTGKGPPPESPPTAGD